MSGEGRGDTGAADLELVEAGAGTLPGESGPSPYRLTARHKFVLAALSIVGVTLVAMRAIGQPDPPAAPEPFVPFPAQVTKLSYATELPSARSGFSLLLRADVDGSQPVELVAVAQPHPALNVSVHGGLPYRVMPGQTAPLTVDYEVVSCDDLPPEFDLAELDVTLRNTRAIQTLSQNLGAQYASALARNMRAACPNTDIRTPPVESTSPDSGVR